MREIFQPGQHVAMHINSPYNAALTDNARRGARKEAGTRAQVGNFHAFMQLGMLKSFSRIQKTSFHAYIVPQKKLAVMGYSPYIVLRTTKKDVQQCQ